MFSGVSERNYTCSSNFVKTDQWIIVFSSGFLKLRFQETVHLNNCFLSEFMKNYSETSQTGEQSVKANFNFDLTCKLSESMWLKLSMPNKVEILKTWYFLIIFFILNSWQKITLTTLLLMNKSETLVTWHLFCFWT